MLKNLLIPVFNKSIVKTCGEIVCQDLKHFFINCNMCKIKIFDFYEFVDHIRKIHLDEFAKEKPTNIKQVEDDEADNQYYRRIIKREGDHLEKSDNPPENTEYAVKCERNEEDHDDFQWDDKTDFDREGNDDEEDYETIDNDDKNNDEEELTVLKKPRRAKELPCETCGKMYVDSKRLKLHITVAHLREKPFKCDHCSESFSFKRSLDHHIGITHTGFNCHLCDKVLRSKPTLKRHIASHSAERSFICDTDNCGKAFFSRRQLRDHQVHHKEPELMCEECGFKCYRREALVVHQRNHTGEKPYACEKCDRRFTTKSLLCEHQASHSERKHICDVCGKSFNRPKALYHHKHLHLGIKKFVCKICGSAYAQAAGLSAHTRKHREVANVSFIREECHNNNIMKAKDVNNTYTF